MSYLTDQIPNQGLLIQQTPVFDVGLLYTTDVNSADFKELLVRLYQQINNISIAVNLKASGLYSNMEFMTGKLYFSANNDPNFQRPIYMKVVDTGALISGTPKVIPHGLVIGNTVNNTWSFIAIYGAANNPSTRNYYPIPYPTTTYISVTLDDTNIYIDNESGVDFTASEIILEYIKT